LDEDSSDCMLLLGPYLHFSKQRQLIFSYSCTVSSLWATKMCHFYFCSNVIIYTMFKNGDSYTWVHGNNWHTSVWVLSTVIDFMLIMYNTRASTSFTPWYLSIYNQYNFLYSTRGLKCFFTTAYNTGARFTKNLRKFTKDSLSFLSSFLSLFMKAIIPKLSKVCHIVNRGPPLISYCQLLKTNLLHNF